MRPLSNRAFDAVTRLFHSVSGIKLTEAKHALVTGRLQRMATEAGEPDLAAYVDKLLRGGAPAQEMTKLIDRLTTNETYFFREPQHYNDLADRLAQVPAGHGGPSRSTGRCRRSPSARWRRVPRPAAWPGCRPPRPRSWPRSRR